MLQKIFKKHDTPKPIIGKYFFLHIPKTAGTTFRHLLYDHFAEEQIYPNQSQLINNGGGYLNKKEFIAQIPQLPENVIFTGHYNWNVTKHFDSSLKTIVFFREPIARTKSHIKHQNRYHPKLRGLPYSEILQLSQKRLANLQARQLGFRPKKKNFNQVLRHLRAIDVIGITEEFETSINQVNRQFRWEISYDKQMDKNQHPNKDLHQFTKEDEELIAKINKVDIRLYQRVLKRFEQQVIKSEK